MRRRSSRRFGRLLAELADSRPRGLRALYVCYLALDDPLVHTQVVAYLRGLASAGNVVHLLTFETARLSRRRRHELRATMAAAGIAWHGLRYHKRPSLPATVLDTIAGAGLVAWLGRRHGLDVVHARAHVPAAMALLARVAGRRRQALIFDVRGLMAEEYEDAGRWRRDSVPFRLTKAVERAALRRAAGIVVLTERIREQLFGTAPRPDVSVIPCCADLLQIQAAASERATIRARLGVGDETPVLVYVGKFTGWYMAAEMAAFFHTAREVIPGLHFLVLTQAHGEEIEQALRAVGADPADVTITSAPHDRVGAYLAAADAAISFIRPSPSKASSSPTKIGEYLGAGLPIACTAGVGDLDAQITPEIGVLVDAHDSDSHLQAARRLAELMAGPDTASRCQTAARALFSLDEVGLPRYRALYEHVSRQMRSRDCEGDARVRHRG
jgi:glycosyltransferase involved in cell wall biosynthesis